jgi:hypothetical protein
MIKKFKERHYGVTTTSEEVEEVVPVEEIKVERGVSPLVARHSISSTEKPSDIKTEKRKSKEFSGSTTATASASASVATTEPKSEKRKSKEISSSLPTAPTSSTQIQTSTTTTSTTSTSVSVSSAGPSEAKVETKAPTETPTSEVSNVKVEVIKEEAPVVVLSLSPISEPKSTATKQPSGTSNI